MPNIEIYFKSWCSYSRRALALLQPLLSDVSHEPLPERQTHTPDGARIEPDRGPKGELVQIGVGEIDRADVRIEPLGHEVRDIRERLLEVVRAGDDLRDIREK